MFLLTMMDSFYGVLKLKNIRYWMRNKLSIDCFYLSEELLQHYSIVIVI